MSDEQSVEPVLNRVSKVSRRGGPLEESLIGFGREEGTGPEHWLTEYTVHIVNTLTFLQGSVSGSPHRTRFIKLGTLLPHS